MEVKVKPVELIELFYDLIFVYAISKLTSIISEPVGGIIPPHNLFIYIITSFVILQAWLYFTNYVNRYGTWEWQDYLLVCVNMIAVIYMANTISPNWTSMSLTFNLSMLIMLLTVILLYITSEYIILIDVVAVLGGAFLPFFIRGHFDKSVISFPHLVERFELLTIITFGEAIVGLTHFFDVENFTIVPIIVFFIVLTMFGSYLIQIHNLMEHHRVERSLRLMFSHYFIVISINLVTVAFELIHSGDVNHLFVAVLMIISLIIFYVSIMANKEYYKQSIKLTKKDIIKMIVVTVVGIAIILIFISNLYAFLMGSLIITFGNFEILLMKQKRCLSE